MSLYGEIRLDPSNANKAIDSVQRKATGLDKAIGKVGNSFGNRLVALFSVGAVVGGISRFTEKVQQIVKLGRDFKMSTNSVQAVQDYAQRTGDSFEQIASDAKKLDEALRDAEKRKLAVISPETLKQVAQLKGDIAGIFSQVEALAANSLGGTARLAGSGLGGLAVAAGGLALGGLRVLGGQVGFNFGNKNNLPAADFSAKSKLDAAGELKQFNAEQAFFDATASREQKRARIRGEIASVLELRREVQFGTADPSLSEAGLNARLAELKLSGFNLTKADAKEQLGIINKRGLPSDSLRSVGNFLGSDPNAIMQQELTTLKDVQTILKKIEANTKERTF